MCVRTCVCLFAFAWTLILRSGRRLSAIQTFPSLIPLQGILERLRAAVDARRISVHPLLQDADRRLGFTKGVTAGQLRRVMDTLGLTLADTDMPFLIAKFSNPVTGHFNYHAFCAAIDPCAFWSLRIAVCLLTSCMCIIVSPRASEILCSSTQ
jgi:hypothetical protein